MRNFYMFNISDEIAILTKNNPYNLFKVFENIYYLDKDEYNTAMDVLEQITLPMEKEVIKDNILAKYKDNDFYSVVNNKHTFNNLYLAEVTNLYVKSTYLLLKSSAIRPVFFKELQDISNLFICDFENKDYFWLKELAI
ncbi:MAG: sporulation inhibitor of replication protein SirA [Bacilli bacterium]|nr:sporulation inhibitor of replication protein SirA [Bacilli bacterium]